MSFLRGVNLTTEATLGFADAADIGPTAGNGFYTRWPDDLALLQETGVTDIGLTLDWARLQPRPGQLDGDWMERFENILAAADAIGLRTWATLHDGSVPRWFANEGGVDDDEALTKWWPRWVERVADKFGDDVQGWVPFATIPSDAPDQPWIDTWRILAGGVPPVVASIDVAAEPDDVGQLALRYAPYSAQLGLHLEVDFSSDSDPDPELLAACAARWSTTLREVHEQVSDKPLALTSFTAGHTDADFAGTIVESFVAVADDALSDGIEIGTCFVGPAIAGPDSPAGLLDEGRAPTPTTSAYLPPSPGD